MRARNIKPGFFKNEDLAECSPFARLLFAGLWTLADREGRLHDRPKRIKGELFAFDSFEIDPLLAELVAHGFIVRYATAAGVRAIQIAAFTRHQNPHYKEPESTIEPPPGYGPGPGRGSDDGADAAVAGDAATDASAAGVAVGAGGDPAGDVAPEQRRCAGTTPLREDNILHQDGAKTASKSGNAAESGVLVPLIGRSKGAKPRVLAPMIGGETRLIPDSGFLIPPLPPNPPMGGNASAGPCGLKAWLDRERQAGRKPVPADDAVFGWAERVGLQRELLDLAWLAFRRRYLVQYPDKRYRDWRRVFRNAVEGNWLRLWYCDPREGFALTTVGVQAKRTLVEAAA